MYIKAIAFRYFPILISLMLPLSAETIVKINGPETPLDNRQDYYIQILKLALEKTKATHGSFRIDLVPHTQQARRSLLLASGDPALDIFASMTSAEREKSMLVVRIPLLKGLMGARIALIRSDFSQSYSQVRTIEQLKKLAILQGHDWPDTEILRYNGFKVATGSNYEGLFQMLNLGRGDLFFRGVNEPFDELKAHPDLPLSVDDHIILYYFAPFFFFVNTAKPDLRDRIELGLKIAVKDGSFNQLFNSHPSNQEMLTKVNFKNALIFGLKNPLLTPETKSLLSQPELLYPLPFKESPTDW